MELGDKKAIIVGGASGMARSSAELLHAKGVAIAILDRPQSAGQEVADQLGGTFHPVDVTDHAGTEAAIDAAVEALGGDLHISVNTAGGGMAKRTLSGVTTLSVTPLAADSAGRIRLIEQLRAICD